MEIVHASSRTLRVDRALQEDKKLDLFLKQLNQFGNVKLLVPGCVIIKFKFNFVIKLSLYLSVGLVCLAMSSSLLDFKGRLILVI